MTEPLFKPGVRFLGIPGVFLHHYKERLAEWMNNYRKIGPYFDVWLTLPNDIVQGDGSTPPPVPSIERVHLTGTLVNNKRTLIVRPKTPKDEKRIQAHAEYLYTIYEPDDGRWMMQ